MANSTENMFTLWQLPLTAASLSLDLAETMLGAHEVTDARLPMVRLAWTDPLQADHGEMTRIATEKADAFGLSHRTMKTASERVRRAAQVNAWALGRLSGGDVLGASDWFGAAERKSRNRRHIGGIAAAALAPTDPCRGQCPPSARPRNRLRYNSLVIPI